MKEFYTPNNEIWGKGKILRNYPRSDERELLQKFIEHGWHLVELDAHYARATTMERLRWIENNVPRRQFRIFRFSNYIDAWGDNKNVVKVAFKNPDAALVIKCWS